MPISLREYHHLPEKNLKSNRDLLNFMKFNTPYTTTDLQKFLEIQHPAALQRLKKLKKSGYLKLEITKKEHKWFKEKDWPEEDEIEAITYL